MCYRITNNYVMHTDILILKNSFMKMICQEVLPTTYSQHTFGSILRWNAC